MQEKQRAKKKGWGDGAILDDKRKKEEGGYLKKPEGKEPKGKVK